MKTLFFQSDLVSSQWDTWVYYHDGTYYLYYLYEEKKRWEGFGLALSKDGICWEDQGIVLKASERMVSYLGTGSVWKAPDFDQTHTFICNYSEYQMIDATHKVQRIFFATSQDLIHWEKCGETCAFDVDEQYYEKFGRWDCINTIPDPAGGYYGTWTATHKGKGAEVFGIGFGHSKDGLHWTAAPCMEIEPYADEAGAIEKIGERYYAMFGKEMKMWLYVADRVNGPYRLDAKNPLLLAEDTYFSRFFHCNGELLVNHHAITRFRAASGYWQCYMAPIKKAVVQEDTLWLMYWDANDQMKQRGVLKKGTLDAEPGTSFLMEGVLSQAQSISIGHATEWTELCYPNANTLVIQCGQEERKIEKALQLPERVKVKILLKESVFEVYLDNYYFASFSMPQPFNGQIKAEEIQIWQVTDQ